MNDNSIYFTLNGIIFCFDYRIFDPTIICEVDLGNTDVKEQTALLESELPLEVDPTLSDESKKEEPPRREIPGFPFASIFIGVIVSIGLLYFNGGFRALVERI